MKIKMIDPQTDEWVESDFPEIMLQLHDSDRHNELIDELKLMYSTIYKRKK